MVAIVYQSPTLLSFWDPARIISTPNPCVHHFPHLIAVDKSHEPVVGDELTLPLLAGEARFFFVVGIARITVLYPVGEIQLDFDLLALDWGIMSWPVDLGAAVRVLSSEVFLDSGCQSCGNFQMVCQFPKDGKSDVEDELPGQFLNVRFFFGNQVIQQYPWWETYQWMGIHGWFTNTRVLEDNMCATFNAWWPLFISL